ncbi:MAG TPA: M48 family metallopeptidase, partial [Chitinophagaceae bacterium]|nr:M48 family metallopeptidase [Chitinophagaceae bacterium]
FHQKIFPFLFCLISLFTKAQLGPVYSFKKDDTILRKNYYEQSLKKETEIISSLGKEYQVDYKKIYEQRFKEISSLWQSSRPLTSPDANNYLQSIVKKIITANPDIKGTDARIVFTRDWWPNAFSMGDGSIAINAGLMIFLDNEAELVFVICHELAHYHLDHSGKTIKKYVETINSEAYQKELKKLSKQQYRVGQQTEELAKSMTFDSRRHNRDNEAEADRWAFQHMKNTGYDCGAIKTALTSLNKMDDSLLFKPLVLEQTFNFNEYPFKKKWVEKESAIFSQLNEDDAPLTKKEKDSLKTHPDCERRIAFLEDSLERMALQSGKKFLVDERIFKQLKKDLFLEMIEECFTEKSLSRNLYYNLLMLQAGENTSMAVYSVSRCLNHIYENQKAHRLGLMVDAEDKRYPDDYNLLLRMLNRLKLDEITTLNYQFCKQHYEQMKDYPGFRDEIKKIQKQKN